MLASQGFFEIMTNSLVPEGSNNLWSTENKPVKMLNPLSSDLSEMRTSMLYSGLEALAYNLNRQTANLKFFEFGKTYHKLKNKNTERRHLSLFLAGNKAGSSWAAPEKKTDFFFLKGMVETLFVRLGLTEVETVPYTDGVFSEGLECKCNGKHIGLYGVISKSILKKMDLKQEVFHADFDWDNILEILNTENIVFKEIPKFPSVNRDLALLVVEGASFQQVYEIAWKTEKKLLRKVNLFDVYTGKNLPKGKKSYAVSFTLQDETKTLTDKQIDKIMSKLTANYKKELNAELR